MEESPGPLAWDDAALSFASAELGRVTKLAVTGSKLEPIAVDLGWIGGIAVDAQSLYVAATSQGRILRFPKDGSAAQPSATTGSCPMPLGAAEDIAATPREDVNLEQLALRLDSERVVASQETYERVVADVRAIRALDPQVAEIGSLPHDDAKTLLLSMSDLAFRSVEAGTYSAWDCLNNFYGLSRKPANDGLGARYAVVSLDGNYNLDLLQAV